MEKPTDLLKFALLLMFVGGTTFAVGAAMERTTVWVTSLVVVVISAAIAGICYYYCDRPTPSGDTSNTAPTDNKVSKHLECTLLEVPIELERTFEVGKMRYVGGYFNIYTQDVTPSLWFRKNRGFMGQAFISKYKKTYIVSNRWEFWKGIIPYKITKESTRWIQEWSIMTTQDEGHFIVSGLARRRLEAKAVSTSNVLLSDMLIEKIFRPVEQQLDDLENRFFC